MTGFIPEEKVSEIQRAADIVEVISDYVMLKKTGFNYVGLCPFHSEKAPSFTVSPEKQIFYCFGCAEGGSVFNFMIKHEGLSFGEAVRSVARRYGIDIPSNELTPQQKRGLKERESLFNVNREATVFYRDCLVGKDGKKALDYLVKRRIDKKIIDRFQLGYAPSGWGHLSDFLKGKKYDLRIAEKSGLLMPRKSGNGYYDRFRDRIVFPICDIQKRIIGFGARVLSDDLPKYLNSPETPVFNKSRSLYGLDLSRHRCREAEAAFLVEGYFDLIALYQHGIENVVATLGTSLTADHVRALRGYVRQVFLVFDSDQAGIKAAQRSIGRFMAEGLDARIMLLPKPHDPDSFIFENGPDAFLALAEKSKGIMAFLTGEAIKHYGLSVEGKVRIIEELKPVLAQVEDRVARSLYIQELSDRIGVDQAALLEKIKAETTRKYSKGAGYASRGLSTSAALSKQGQAPGSKRKNLFVNQNRTEEKLISMMLQFPDSIPDIVHYGVIDLFENEALARIGRKILTAFTVPDSKNTDDVFCMTDPEDQRIAASLAIKTDHWNRKGCIKLILKYKGDFYNKKKNRILEQIKVAEKKQDHDRLFQLLREKHLMAIECEKRKMAILE